MKKITELTKEQHQAMLAYRDDWLAIGRSTETADRDTAERVFADMYKALGRDKPRVWWYDGPASAIEAKKDVGTSIWGSIVTNFGDNLKASLGSSLKDNFAARLIDNIGVSIGDSLMGNLWRHLGDKLRASLWNTYGDDLYFHFWGSHESYWPAYYAWPENLRDIYSKEDRIKLGYWLDLSRSCGWWEPYENVVVACERPSVYRFDDSGLLHCEDGPAIVCRDGWEVHCWHGTNVPSEWVTG